MAADLDAQVEAFLRNATRQRKTEDRAIRQALQALKALTALQALQALRALMA